MAVPLGVYKLPLSPTALRLYCVLEPEAPASGWFPWPPLAVLLDRLPPKMDDRTVRRAREELVEAGLLHGGPRGWLLLTPPPPAMTGPPPLRRDPFAEAEATALEPAAAPTATPPCARRIGRIQPAALIGFNEFYAAYPHKRARDAAERAWAKCGAAIDAVLRTAIATALERQKAWAAEDAAAARFVPEWPYPATWLNGKRWLDERGAPQPPRGGGPGANNGHGGRTSGNAAAVSNFVDKVKGR